MNIARRTCVVALMLFAICDLAISQDYAVGNWFVTKSRSDLQIAKVYNSNNSTGIICIVSDNSCFAYATLGFSCEDGKKYPLLINAATSAFNSTATCSHLSPELEILVIDEFELMITAFESGGDIGFASPLKNGQFKVMRFSTVGATAAIKDARNPPSRPGTNPKPVGSKPQYL